MIYRDESSLAAPDGWWTIAWHSLEPAVSVSSDGWQPPNSLVNGVKTLEVGLHEAWLKSLQDVNEVSEEDIHVGKVTAQVFPAVQIFLEPILKFNFTGRGDSWFCREVLA